MTSVTIGIPIGLLMTSIRGLILTKKKLSYPG
nr:MAG TPA: hypothetical protein [Caudoviricetes sp.]